jgi:hypothetical protein
MIGALIGIWKGGVIFYADDQLDAIKEALVKFQQKDDTKAALLLFMTYSSGQVCFVMTASVLI